MAAWTDKRAMVKSLYINKKKKKKRSKQHPDLTFKAHIEEITEVYNRVAGEGKHKQWKSFCDNVNRDTTLAHFWQFYQQMEGTPTS